MRKKTRGLAPTLPWPRAALQVRAEGVNEPREHSSTACYDNDHLFPDKRRTASQSMPRPLLAGLTPEGPGDMQGQRRHCHRRSCPVSMPASSRARARRGKWSQPGSHPAPSSKPRALALGQPTEHQRAFLALRGIPSLPAPTPPSSLPSALPARGVWHIWLGGLGRSPWPWDGKGCLLVPPCPVGRRTGWEWGVGG